MVQLSSPTNTPGGNNFLPGHERQELSTYPTVPWLSHLVTVPAGSSRHTPGRPPDRLPQGGAQSVCRGMSGGAPGHTGMHSRVCLQTHMCTCHQYSQTATQQTLAPALHVLEILRCRAHRPHRQPLRHKGRHAGWHGSQEKTLPRLREQSSQGRPPKEARLEQSAHVVPSSCTPPSRSSPGALASTDQWVLIPITDAPSSLS